MIKKHCYVHTCLPRWDDQYQWQGRHAHSYNNHLDRTSYRTCHNRPLHQRWEVWMMKVRTIQAAHSRVPVLKFQLSHQNHRESLKRSNGRLLKLLLVGVYLDDWIWICFNFVQLGPDARMVYLTNSLAMSVWTFSYMSTTYVHTHVCPLTVVATKHARWGSLHGCWYLWWGCAYDNSLCRIPPSYLPHSLATRMWIRTIMSSGSVHRCSCHAHTLRDWYAIWFWSGEEYANEIQGMLSQLPTIPRPTQKVTCNIYI